MPDKQGRVHLPAPLVRHGKLGKDVTVVGSNDHLEIWDRAAWAERLEGIEGSADNVAQRLAATARLITSPSSRTRCAGCSPSQPGETVVDATFGAGGHARLLADDLDGQGKLVAIDRDPSVKAHFDRFKAQAGVDVRFLRGDFAVVLSQLAANGIKADAILLDIGVSSMQIDRPERGFSYATDAPLDMRMDPSGELDGRDRSSTRGTSASSRRSSGASARSATRGRSPARSCGGAPSARSSAPATSST